ncbi:hypothetical protein Tco_0233367 [Tanacetum coccineum]
MKFFQSDQSDIDVQLLKYIFSRAQFSWGSLYKKNVDYAKLIWEDIEYQIENRKTSAKRQKNMPYPRFTKVIIHYFLSKHRSIPKRHNSFINTIKDDGVLGKLKYVSKGEDKQMYGMSILDVMMNDDIKNSNDYLTYLALSTGTEVPNKGRGKGKGLMGKKATVNPSKKGSITADDNIIPDPDVALKLGESISRTEAEEQKEARRVHERLVIKMTSNNEEEGRMIRRRSSGVVIRYTPKVSLDETLDQSQKLKGSSEGAGITLEVPDELKGSSAAQADEDDWGSKGEIKTLSSDDERTKSEREVAESDKADEETDNDEETHNDEELHEDEEVHDDDEKHDDDEVVDEEKANEEMPDSEKADEEMADAEKDNKEKPKLPPSSSSLSLSSDYGNQFLNVSSDVSLVGIVKETSDTEINSLLDIPVQQEMHHVQQTPLLDVLVSMIPTMTTPTPSTTPPTTKKVEALPKVDPSEVIEESVQANVRNEVRNELPKVVSEFVEQILERIKSRLFHTHDKHLDLYNALIGSIGLDEAIAKGEIDATKVLKKRRHDDKDEDPFADSKKKKRKRKRKDYEPSKDKEQPIFSPKQPPRTETLDLEWSKDTNADVGPEQTWFNDLEKAAKDPAEFDDLRGSTIDFLMTLNNVKMDKSDLTIEEYIKLHAEKARRHGQTFNWETATYGKIYYDDFDLFTGFEADFPAIVYNDASTSNQNVSSEPIDLFSYKLFPVSDLKPEPVNDHIEINTELCSENIDTKQMDSVICTSNDTAPIEFDENFETNHDVKCETSKKRWRLHEKIAEAKIWLYHLEIKDTRFSGLRGWSRPMRILLISRGGWGRMAEGVIDLDVMVEMGSVGVALSYTLIKDPLLRLCHRLIAFSIAGRSQAPKKVTSIDFFYLRSIDVGSVNIHYLLAQYLRRYTLGRKRAAMISGGGTRTREAAGCYGWSPVDVEGAHTEVEGVQAVPAPVQASQPPLVAAPVVRTMPQRMTRLKEEAHRLRESLDEQREVMDAMAKDFSRFTVRAASGISQLLDLSGATYTRYSETHVPYQRRRVRQRTDGANTSAPQQPDP